MALPPIAFLVLAQVVVTSASRATRVRLPATASFEQYAATYRRSIAQDSPEYELRRSLFEKRAEIIRAHNERPGRRWTAGFNKLTDRTEGELSHLFGWRHTGPAKARGAASGSGPAAALLAESVQRNSPPAKTVDWGHLAAVGQIEDQGGCGACWALAATTVLQAHYEIHMKGSKNFSTQELLSCVPNPMKCGGDGGCQGATVELAMAYAQKNGLRSAEELPYTQTTGTCPEAASFADTSFADKGAATMGLVGWSKLPENKARPVMLALMDGPVSISVGADEWTNYEGGIFDGCDPDNVVNHAVVLLGYGVDAESFSATTKYWSIQNSWGPDWGEDGRIRLLRHDDVEEDEKYCGTDHSPKDGTACAPYPDSVKVCGLCGMFYDSVAVHFAKTKDSEPSAQAFLASARRSAFLDVRSFPL